MALEYNRVICRIEDLDVHIIEGLKNEANCKEFIETCINYDRNSIWIHYSRFLWQGQAIGDLQKFMLIARSEE